MRTWWLALCLVGCASAPTPKLKLEEAFARHPGPAPRAVLSGSGPLDAAVGDFQAEGRSARDGKPPGAPMPRAHAAAWHEVLDRVDAALTAPARQVSPLDLARARLLLEAELEVDRGVFGDVPLDLAERIPRSLRRLSQRLAATAPKKRADPTSFMWPVAPVVLTSAWGHRLHPMFGDYRFHAGIDLLAELSQPVRAVSDGTVVFAGWNGAHGKQVELQHDARLTTSYSHLQTVLVRPGVAVKRGDIIGLAGQTGQATGPHLHFEVHRDGESVDPEALLPEPPRPSLVSWGAVR